MIAMRLDIDQLQADLAANKPSHLVATMKLLRQQQMRQKKRMHTQPYSLPLYRHIRAHSLIHTYTRSLLAHLHTHTW